MNAETYDYEELSELLDHWSESVKSVRDTLYPRATLNASLYNYKKPVQKEQQTDGQIDEQIDNQIDGQAKKDTESVNLSSIQESIHSVGRRVTKTLNGTQRFNLSEVLGEGTFGRVWGATDNDLNRQVAIKGFKGPIEQAKMSCIGELQYVGGLDHPSIPTVYDTGLTEEGIPFVVMKFVDGKTLSSIIKKLKEGDPETHQRFSFERRVELIVNLLRATKASHDQGILHRDIKPDNILISPDGHLWLIDWGCATSLEDVKKSSDLCGTPLFMPPEQVLRGGLTIASDLFAVASVAYEFLSLHRAGPLSNKVKETLHAVLSHNPKVVYTQSHPTQGYVPAEFGGIIMQALERKPELRPQSSDEMIDWFERALSGNIEIVCARTRLKSRLCQLMKWVNQDPYKRMRYIRLSLAAIALLLIGLGSAISSLLL